MDKIQQALDGIEFMILKRPSESIANIEEYIKIAEQHPEWENECSKEHIHHLKIILEYNKRLKDALRRRIYG